MNGVKNARIIGTFLGFEHGVFTATVTLDYGDSQQGFGGYSLDGYDEDLKRRVGSAFGCEFIASLLTVVGARRWEDLKGTYVRARLVDDRVVAIGDVLKDVWFDPKEIATR